EDLAQRDLTINAIARSPDRDRYVDPFDGIADVRDGRLRMVAEDAFMRDPLRAMRLVRLACELGFTIDPATRDAAAACAAAVADIAPERVFAELKLTVAS